MNHVDVTDQEAEVGSSSSRPVSRWLLKHLCDFEAVTEILALDLEVEKAPQASYQGGAQANDQESSLRFQQFESFNKS